MRNLRSFLGSCILLGLLGCAGTPPPPPITPAEPPSPADPAPPADPPPPPADPAPAPPPPAPAPERAAAYTGPEPCKLALKGSSPVAQACREGGAKQAKVVMKDLVKRAKDAGAKFRCDDCHKDPQDFTKLAADAPDKFKRLLAAAR